MQKNKTVEGLCGSTVEGLCGSTVGCVTDSLGIMDNLSPVLMSLTPKMVATVVNPIEHVLYAAIYPIDEILTGSVVRDVTSQELYRWLYVEKRDVQLIDLRTTGEFGQGHIEGTVNVPIQQLRSYLPEIDPSKPTVLICASSLRSYLGTILATTEGIEAYSLQDGLSSWILLDYPTVK